MSKVHDALTANRACPYTRVALEDYELQQGWQPTRIGAFLACTNIVNDDDDAADIDADIDDVSYDSATDADYAHDADDADIEVTVTIKLKLDQ